MANIRRFGYFNHLHADSSRLEPIRASSRTWSIFSL